MDFIYNPSANIDLMMIIGIVMAFFAIRSLGKSWNSKAYFGKLEENVTSLYSVNVEKLGVFLVFIELSYMPETRLYAALAASLALAFSSAIGSFIKKEYQS